MKRIILLLLISIPFIFSCDDEVNPKSDFKSIYVLNCIIRSDTTYQAATLSHTYDVDGYDPYSNTEDPFINNASIIITYNGKEYIMKDTVGERIDTSRYKGQLKYFCLRDFQPADYSKIKIEAFLPGGSKLASETYTFRQSGIYMDITGLSTRKFSANDLSGGFLSFGWGTLEGQDINYAYFIPEIVIVYTKEINGIKTKYTKKIPHIYIEESGYLPIYPGIYVGSGSLSYKSTTIDRAMMEIAGNDPDKQSYVIEKVFFRLLILDENLAAYYAAQQTFMNEFSLRSYQPDFTNIVGGMGVFGTYNIKSQVMEIDPAYVTEFGYKSP